MDASGDLARPDPAAAQFVAIAALIEEDISWLKFQLGRHSWWYADSGDRLEIQIATLDIRDTEIGDLDYARVVLTLRILRDSTDDFCDVTKGHAGPAASERGIGHGSSKHVETHCDAPYKLDGRVMPRKVLLDRRHDAPLFGKRRKWHRAIQVVRRSKVSDVRRRPLEFNRRSIEVRPPKPPEQVTRVDSAAWPKQLHKVRRDHFCAVRPHPHDATD
jgi:hypothetical protein